MKCLTQKELDGLIPLPASATELQAAAERLVASARNLGLVLTVEQRPLSPLAMGCYETVVLVRQARGAP